MTDVLEVDFVQLSPVLAHLVELSVSVSESFHLGFVGLQLILHLLELLFHGSNVERVLLVNLLQLLQLILVVVSHSPLTLDLSDSDGQLQISFLDALSIKNQKVVVSVRINEIKIPGATYR